MIVSNDSGLNPRQPLGVHVVGNVLWPGHPHDVSHVGNLIDSFRSGLEAVGDALGPLEDQ